MGQKKIQYLSVNSVGGGGVWPSWSKANFLIFFFNPSLRIFFAGPS